MRPFGRHFDRLLRRYGLPFVLLRPTPGRYDAGVYLEGEPEEWEGYGAALPQFEKTSAQPGGSRALQQYTLLVQSPLPGPLPGIKLRLLGQTYRVEEGQNLAAYGDVAVYHLTRLIE